MKAEAWNRSAEEKTLKICLDLFARMSMWSAMFSRSALGPPERKKAFVFGCKARRRGWMERKMMLIVRR